MAREEVVGQGFTLTIGEAVVQVTQWTPPARKRNIEDTTVFSDLRVRKSGGLIDDGDAKVEMVFAPTQHDSLIASFESGDAEDCVATFADGSTESFLGILSEFAIQPFSPQTAAIRASATIAVTFGDDGEEADVYVFNPAGGS